MVKKLIKKWIDPEVTTIETPEGKISLKKLFIPMLIEQLLVNMMGTVNTLTLGHYSDNAVAAVGAANQVIGLVFTLFAVVGGGASVVISHKLGAGQKEEAGVAGISAVFFGGILSAVMSVVMALNAMTIMSALNLEGEILIFAEEYFRICISFAFFQGILSAGSAVLRSNGKPNVAVGISLTMNLINAIMNILIVFRPIEIPLYGVNGIAVANVFSHAVVMVILLFILFGKSGYLAKKVPFSRMVQSLKSILKIGVPGGMSSLSYSMSQVVSTSILAVLGGIALSTKIYVSSIVFYVYVIGMSLGLSTAILIGWMTGAKEYDKAYRLNQQVLKIAVSLNIVLSIVIYLFHQPLMSLFTDSAEIIQLSGTIFLIDIFVEIGRAFNHVENSSLQGAGDVVFPMVVSIISCWLISILFSYILGIQLGLGLAGCWIAFVLDELFRGLIYWARFRSKKWMNKNI